MPIPNSCTALVVRILAMQGFWCFFTLFSESCPGQPDPVSQEIVGWNLLTHYLVTMRRTDEAGVWLVD